MYSAAPPSAQKSSKQAHIHTNESKKKKKTEIYIEMEILFC